MSAPNLKNLLKTVIEANDFSAFSAHYLHRSARETPLTLIRGRDGLVADEMARAAEIRDAEIDSLVSVGNMIALTINGRAADGTKLSVRRHQWFGFEGERIAHDLVIDDRSAVTVLGQAEALGQACPAHAPLGELSSGRGQLPVGDVNLGSDVAESALPVLGLWHRLWNGRDFSAVADLYASGAEWHGPEGDKGLSGLKAFWLSTLTALPDAVLHIDRVEADDKRLAILWRLHGHFTGASLDGIGNEARFHGRRVRILGSSVLRLKDGQVTEDDTLIDRLSVRAQLYQPIIIL